MNSNVLYKYLDADGGLKMLQNSNLQFTNATRLNDPFDCHPALFDYSNAPEMESGWPSPAFISSMEEQFNKNQRDSTWICSLSKNYNSLLMWSYYGNHQGVCIGLDIEKAKIILSKIMCRTYIGAMEMEVQYREIIEKPDYFNDVEDYFTYQLSTKAKEWEHEQEVRLLLIEPLPGFVQMSLPYEPKDEKEVTDWKEFRAYPQISAECFCSLYLGVNMKQENRNEVIETAKNLNPNIAIYQMTTDPEAFRLKEKSIE